MLSPKLRERLAASTRLQWILWLALTTSVVIYAVLPFLADFGRGAPPPAALEPALWAVALAAAAGSVAVHRRTHDPQRLRTRALAAAQEAESSAAALGGEPPSEAQRVAGAVPALTFTPWIVCMVLNESVAIHGLVGAMLFGTPARVLPFAALALALNALMVPRPERLARRALGFTGM